MVRSFFALVAFGRPLLAAKKYRSELEACTFGRYVTLQEKASFTCGLKP